MFIVVAHHNTGHRELGTPFFVTDDLEQAVTQAKRAQALGFEFYSTDACVSIYHMKIGTAYDKTNCYSKTPVWIRRRSNKEGWLWLKEEWLKDPQRLDCSLSEWS